MQNGGEKKTDMMGRNGNTKRPMFKAAQGSLKQIVCLIPYIYKS